MTNSPTPPDAKQPLYDLDQRLKVNESWLLRLRWVAVSGQLLTIAVAHFLLKVDLHVTPLLIIVGATAATNLLFALWLRDPQQAHSPIVNTRDHYVLFAVMTLDLVALTGLLYFSGGPTNPFTIFYFVNLALAAVLLPWRFGWTQTLFAVLCLSALFFWHIPLPELTTSVGPEFGFRASDITLAQLGFAVAFVGCGAVVSYFITRVTRELQQREYDLRIAVQQRARSERLESLATLAAGAGHELASPLSTIAVIANDLARHLEGTNVPASVVEDVQLIRGELDYCRQILDRLASSAGQATGEGMELIRVEKLVEEIIGGIRRRQRVLLELTPDTGQRNLLVPRVGTAQAIRGIIRNALDASGPDQTVRVHVHSDAENGCRFAISDQGTGMKPEILTRVGEPFFTTKETGKGMGLGVFLARNVVERLGGSFLLRSTPGEGTTVTIRLPWG